MMPASGNENDLNMPSGTIEIFVRCYVEVERIPQRPPEWNLRESYLAISLTRGLACRTSSPTRLESQAQRELPLPRRPTSPTRMRPEV